MKKKAYFIRLFVGPHVCPECEGHQTVQPTAVRRGANHKMEGGHYLLMGQDLIDLCVRDQEPGKV